MKKRIICIIGMIVISVMVIIKFNNKTYYTEIDNVKYAIFVDGQQSSSFPTGNYKAEIKCSNGDGYWDAVSRKVIVKNVDGMVSCHVSFTSITNDDYLNNYLLDLVGVPQGDGKIVNDYESTLNDDPTWEYVEMNYDQATLSPSFNSTYYSVGTSDNTRYSGYYSYSFYPKSEGFYEMCYTTYSHYYSGECTSMNISFTGFTNYSGCYHNGTSGCTSQQFLTPTDKINLSVSNGYGADQRARIYFKKSSDYTAEYAGYRFKGSNPNNYIWYNNELWRIIGVFDESNHGQTGKNLVKIIRSTPINASSYGSTSNWSASPLKTILNGDYYNNTGNYILNGIKQGYREMIETVDWHLSSISIEGNVASIFHDENDSTNVPSGNSSSVTAKIGLIYASDRLLSDTNCTSNSAYSICYKNNWLYDYGFSELTITPISDQNVAGYYSSSIQSLLSTRENGVRPALYLSTNTYVVSGTGTITDPYIIGFSAN